MNIRNGIDNLAQIAPQEKFNSSSPVKQASTSPAEPAQTDRAVLSNAASELSFSPQESDVRLDKVASIQNALASGTYHVDPADVAKKVISSMLPVKI